MFSTCSKKKKKVNYVSIFFGVKLVLVVCISLLLFFNEDSLLWSMKFLLEFSDCLLVILGEPLGGET